MKSTIRDLIPTHNWTLGFCANRFFGHGFGFSMEKRREVGFSLKIEGLGFNFVGEVCRIGEKLGFGLRWRRKDGSLILRFACFVFQSK
ncbi:hypothetical protein A2U01_0007379 [Trifolium medium]|uniref:Uncharacterized protein n=1 Tax=Trifolium medium TaxID=97028 RepID=A0A392MGS8_9FABA|nr:hypothetical protein [Trifolium medium]